MNSQQTETYETYDLARKAEIVAQNYSTMESFETSYLMHQRKKKRPVVNFESWPQFSCARKSKDFKTIRKLAELDANLNIDEKYSYKRTSAEEENRTKTQFFTNDKGWKVLNDTVISEAIHSLGKSTSFNNGNDKLDDDDNDVESNSNSDGEDTSEGSSNSDGEGSSDDDGEWNSDDDGEGCSDFDRNGHESENKNSNNDSATESDHDDTTGKDNHGQDDSDSGDRAGAGYRKESYSQNSLDANNIDHSNPAYNPQFESTNLDRDENSGYISFSSERHVPYIEQEIVNIRKQLEIYTIKHV